jgi:acetyl esterase/lipase
MNDSALGKSLEAQLTKGAIAHGAGLLAAVARVVADLRGDLADLQIATGLSYGDHPAQRYDVWRSKRHSGSDAPLVLFLHGGGFQHLDRGSHWAFAERFAHAGAVVINADYRLAPQHRFPAAAEDAALVYRHALATARSLGADPSQVIVSGTSAGANLALGVAINAARAADRGEGIAPRAAVLLSGLLQVSDIKRLYRHRRVVRPLRARMASIAVDYLPQGGDDPGAWARPALIDPRLDPLLYLEETALLPSSLPALFVSSGTRDQVLEDSLRLRRAMVDTDVPCALDVVAGASHSFQGLTFRSEVRALWERCFAFLRAHDLQLASARSSGAAS